MTIYFQMHNFFREKMNSIRLLIIECFDDFLDQDDFYQSFMSFQTYSNEKYERNFSLGQMLVRPTLRMGDAVITFHLGDRAEIFHMIRI